jgi:uncharacterized membrane protein YgcG
VQPYAAGVLRYVDNIADLFAHAGAMFITVREGHGGVHYGQTVTSAMASHNCSRLLLCIIFVILPSSRASAVNVLTFVCSCVSHPHRTSQAVMSYLFFELEPSVVFCTGMFISIAAFFVYYSERVLPHTPAFFQRWLGVGALDGCLAAPGGLGPKTDSFGDIIVVGVGGSKGGGAGGGGSGGGRAHPGDDL